MGLFSSIGKVVGAVFGPAGSEVGGSLGGVIDGARSESSANKANDRNVALQREFAQNSIQWKVADAKAAGIHPLAALGVQGYQAAPSVTPTSTPDYSGMGQNLSRAMNASRDADSRREQLLTEQVALQNDLLRAQTTQVHQATNPAFPGSATVIDGQGNSPARERRTIPDVGFVETEQGGLAPIYSDAVKQRVEDSILPELEWYIRNRINPFAILNGPGKSPRKDHEWSVYKQQYLPAKKGWGFHDKVYWHRK